MDGMTSEHKTHDLSHPVHVQCMTMRSHKMNETKHTQVFVFMCSVWKTVMVVMSSLVSVSYIVTARA